MRTMLLSILLLAAFLAVPVYAHHEGNVPPDSVIRKTTDHLLATVESARGYYSTDPERYYGEIESIITPIVDFYSFSRGVMGRWGSNAYLDSLTTPEQKTHFKDQVRRFSEVFRGALVETYSKGLLAFGGESIEVSAVDPADIAKGETYVVQTIVPGDGSESHIIRYRMRRDGDEHWQVRNVILDEINLGVVYRNQFTSAANKYNGDLDRVIDNWRTGGIDAATAAGGKD